MEKITIDFFFNTSWFMLRPFDDNQKKWNIVTQVLVKVEPFNNQLAFLTHDRLIRLFYSRLKI